MSPILQDDYASARAFYERSLTINREMGNRSGIATSLNNLGGVAYDQGDYASAHVYCDESLAIRKEIVDRSGIASSLEAFARLATRESRSEQATRLLGAAEALRRR